MIAGYHIGKENGTMAGERGSRRWEETAARQTETAGDGLSARTVSPARGAARPLRLRLPAVGLRLHPAGAAFPCLFLEVGLKQTVKPGKIGGTLQVPASKSHTIRGLLIASLARGESRLVRPLLSSDALSCLEACRLLGAAVERSVLEDGSGEEWVINGTAGKIRIPENPIDVGNSGTTLYLAASLAALGEGPVTFTGDRQIRSRPAGPLLEAL